MARAASSLSRTPAMSAPANSFRSAPATFAIARSMPFTAAAICSSHCAIPTTCRAGADAASSATSAAARAPAPGPSTATCSVTIRSAPTRPAWPCRCRPHSEPPTLEKRRLTMSTTFAVQEKLMPAVHTATMRAAVFHAVDDIRIEDVPRPHAGPGEAVIRVTMTTICGTDVHIMRGEYPVKPGLVIGHEPVGVIEELGLGVTGYNVGDRVLVGAITPCGQCNACLSGKLSQCGHGSGYEAIGGWRFGNTINGAQAEYLLVPNAQANLAKIPETLTDEQAVLLADIASTGFSGAESGGVRIGDSVVVFAQGPIGLCATAGAKLMGAALVIGVDGDPNRAAAAHRMGADIVLDPDAADIVSEVKRLTNGY